MTAALEVGGLLALVVAGFLIALWLGFAALGAACLWVAWSKARAVRLVAERDEAQRAARLARNA